MERDLVILKLLKKFDDKYNNTGFQSGEISLAKFTAHFSKGYKRSLHQNKIQKN